MVRCASTIDANDQLKTPGHAAGLIAHKNGAPIRIRDIAAVVDDAGNVRLGCWATLERDGADAAAGYRHQRSSLAPM